MSSPLIGSWRAVRTDIPNFGERKEFLHFTEAGQHVWEVAQPGGVGRPSLTHFTYSCNGDVYRFRVQRANGLPCEWDVKIQSLSAREIAVTPPHGYTSVFELCDPPSAPAESHRRE